MAYNDNYLILLVACVWINLGRDFSPAGSLMKTRLLAMEYLPSQKHVAGSRTRHIEMELDH